VSCWELHVMKGYAAIENRLTEIWRFGGKKKKGLGLTTSTSEKLGQHAIPARMHALPRRSTLFPFYASILSEYSNEDAGPSNWDQPRLHVSSRRRRGHLRCFEWKRDCQRGRRSHIAFGPFGW
jgi:hypothetical protein